MTISIGLLVMICISILLIVGMLRDNDGDYDFSSVFCFLIFVVMWALYFMKI